MRNAGRVLPRKLIEEKLYTGRRGLQQRREVHVHHLRRKLGSDFIRTVHGIGYTWVTHETTCPPEPAPAPDAAVCRTDHRRTGNGQRYRGSRPAKAG